MMSKTHIAVGIASGLALAQTGSLASCIAAVVGGSVGGVIPDCDITPSRAHRDAVAGRLLVVAIVAACLAVDRRTGLGFSAWVVRGVGIPPIAGVGLFATLTFLGSRTEHRSFTHSLLAMAAFCGSVYLVSAALLPFFAIGYASHLALDLANRQPVRLLFPARFGVGLGLCHARGIVNSVVLGAGTAASIGLLWLRLAPLLETALGF